MSAQRIDPTTRAALDAATRGDLWFWDEAFWIVNGEPVDVFDLIAGHPDAVRVSTLWQHATHGTTQ